MVTLMNVICVTGGLLTFSGIFLWCRSSLRHEKRKIEAMEAEDRERMQGARRGRN